MMALEQKKITIDREAFRYKIGGFCKAEKKRTGRCGECLQFDKLIKKIDKGEALENHELPDYTLLLRHKVSLCVNSFI
jgi:hypothetical protein